MDIFLIFLAFLCFIIGIIGSIIPALPGPLMGYIGLLILYFTNQNITENNLILCGCIIAVITILDYFIAPFITRKSGGSKKAAIGSMLGVILCVFILPISIFLGAFLGAYIGELLHDSTNQRKALKVGFYSFIGFLSGIAMALFISIFMLYLGIKSLF